MQALDENTVQRRRHLIVFSGLGDFVIDPHPHVADFCLEVAVLSFQSLDFTVTFSGYAFKNRTPPGQRAADARLPIARGRRVPRGVFRAPARRLEDLAATDGEFPLTAADLVGTPVEYFWFQMQQIVSARDYGRAAATRAPARFPTLPRQVRSLVRSLRDPSSDRGFNRIPVAHATIPNVGELGTRFAHCGVGVADAPLLLGQRSHRPFDCWYISRAASCLAVISLARRPR